MTDFYEENDNELNDYKEDNDCYRSIVAEDLESGMLILHSSEYDNDELLWYIYDVELIYEQSKVIVKCSRPRNDRCHKEAVLEIFTFKYYDKVIIKSSEEDI